jgi:hypothetical protein
MPAARLANEMPPRPVRVSPPAFFTQMGGSCHWIGAFEETPSYSGFEKARRMLSKFIYVEVRLPELPRVGS